MDWAFEQVGAVPAGLIDERIATPAHILGGGDGVRLYCAPLVSAKLEVLGVPVSGQVAIPSPLLREAVARSLNSHRSLTIAWDDVAVRRILRHRLAIGVVALAFAAAGGGAYAASQSGSNPRTPFLNDVARRLNVSPQRLMAAVNAAMVDRLDAAVKDGRLTQAQANAIKQHIEQGGMPPFFMRPGMPFPGPPAFFFGGAPPFGPLSSAASYLGLSEVQLVTDLRSGQSLAQIAKARGKSVAGLERAMISAIKSRLDQAVKSGRLTKSQEQQLLNAMTSRLRDLINGSGTRSLPGPRWAHPGGPGLIPPTGF
jgi:AraC-like DNA-binding protein